MFISDGIPAVPRKRKPRNSVPNPSAEEKQLGIPFRRTKIEANSRNSFPNPSQIHIHKAITTDYTQIKHRGWRKENLPKKGSEQIQQEQRHQQTGDIIFFRVQSSSEGYGVVKKGAAQLTRVQLSSEGCSLVREGNLALRVQRSSDRVQQSSVGCSIAQQGAAQINKVQHISVGCSVAQEGVAWLSKVQNSSVGCSVAQEGVALLSRMQCSFLGCNGAQQGAAYHRCV